PDQRQRRHRTLGDPVQDLARISVRAAGGAGPAVALEAAGRRRRRHAGRLLLHEGSHRHLLQGPPLRDHRRRRRRLGPEAPLMRGRTAAVASLIAVGCAGAPASKPATPAAASASGDQSPAAVSKRWHALTRAKKADEARALCTPWLTSPAKWLAAEGHKC